MKKLLSFLLALILMLGLALPASAATAKAAVMRLELVEGSVTIKDASGVAIPYSEDMRLYSGYSVDTGDDSYAYISLDDSKAIKLDMNTSVVVKKSWRKLKVELKAGQLIFNVTTPLASDEALEIRTSTMITGVRGSSGVVSLREVQYITGHGVVYNASSISDGAFSVPPILIRGGQRYEAESDSAEALALKDIPSIYLEEVAGNEQLQQDISEEGDFIVEELVGAIPEKKAEEAAQREESKEAAQPEESKEAETLQPDEEDANNIEPAFKRGESDGGQSAAGSPTQDRPFIPEYPAAPVLPVIPEEPVEPEPNEPETTAYTVTWQDEDGTILETDKNVPVGTVPEFNGSDPIKAADAQYTYTFAGWDSIPAAVTGDAVYTATYKETPKTYTITWKVDDETTTVKYDYGSVIVPPAAPTKTGYTFTGWGSAVPETMPAENLTFTAQWSINTYTITWKNDDGSVIDTTTVAYGEVPTHAAPTKEADAQFTYTFAGWSPAPASVTGEATYTATYTNNAKTFTIQWMNGGTVFRTDTYDFGIPVANPGTPEKTGYTFSGWDGEIPETMPAENLIFNAVWTVNKYTVTWMVDGVSSPVDYEYGSTVTPPADPTKTGYTFAGWGDAVPETMPAENLSFTAQWTVNKYTVTWTIDGESSPVDYEYGSTVTPPADPTKTGYTFAGWGGTVPATMPAEDLSFTAQWNINKYTVTWLNYDNSELEKDEDVPYGDTPSYNDETPTKPEDSEYTYVFKEWTPAVSSVSGDATYTATFTTRSKVTVTLTEGVESITIGEDTFTATGNYDVPYNEALLVSYTLEDGYADGPTTALMVGDSAVSEGTNAKDGGTSEIPGGSEVKVANLYKHITALNDTQVTMNSIIDSDVALTASFTLNFDLIITEDGALTITEAGNLTLAAGHTITNSGLLNLYGELTNNGTITNEDAIIIQGSGVLTNCSEDTLNNKGSLYLFGTLYNGDYDYDSYQGKVVNSAGAKLIVPGTFLSSDSSSLVNDGLFLYGGEVVFGITSGSGTLAIGDFCGTSSIQTREVLDASPYWYLTGSTGSYNLTICGNGAMGSYDSYDEVPWYGYAEEILSAEIESGITNIGNHAFDGCIELKSISIPDSVATIGDSAFNGCIALGADAGPGLDTAFVIPDTITSIGTSAFRNCGFKAVVISTDSIGANAFSGCESLVTAYFQSVPPTTFSNTVFDGCDAGFRIVYTLENRGKWRDDTHYDYSDPDNNTYYGYRAQAGFKVTFVLNLEVGMDVAEIEPIRVNANSVAEMPNLVDNSGDYEFVGWYTDPAFNSNQAFKPNTPITDDITLYARWRMILEGADP